MFKHKKETILSNKPLLMGVQPRHTHLNNCCFCLLELFTLRRQQLYERCDIHSTHSISYAENSVPTLFFRPIAHTHKNVIRWMTSDFDVCEVDQDMQMSFLNAAPFHANCVAA